MASVHELKQGFTPNQMQLLLVLLPLRPFTTNVTIIDAIRIEDVMVATAFIHAIVVVIIIQGEASNHVGYYVIEMKDDVLDLRNEEESSAFNFP